MIRAILGLVPLAAIFSCGGNYNMTVVNSTDVEFCYSVTRVFEDCDGGFKAHDKREVHNDCYSEDQPMEVFLYRPGGRVIYSRDSTCGAWKESGATLIIEQVGGEFVVTDSLPEVAEP